MAGLLNPNGGVPPQATFGEGDVDGEEQPNVTPEEQAAYDELVNSGLRLIYSEGDQVRPGILKLLDDDPADLIGVLGSVDELENFSPTVALAATAVVIVLELVRRAGEAKPDGDILLHGAKAIIEELGEVAESAGLNSFQEEDLNRAMLIAMDLYRETASAEGLVDTEALSEEFAEILNAQDEGRLNEVLPGLQRFG